MSHIIYLDLDGVLVDFVGGALRLLGLPESDRQHVVEWDALSRIVEDRGMCYPDQGHDYVWARVDMAGEDFWADLPTLPHGAVLLTNILTANIPVVFVTASSRHHSSAAGKQKWLSDNLPHDVYQGKPLHRRFAICPTKHLLAHPGALLVDDRPRNVDLFRGAGGKAVLWPQPWNHDTAEDINAARARLASVIPTLTTGR